MKQKITLFAITTLLLTATHSQAQFEMEKVLRIGYRTGISAYKSAYTSQIWDSGNNTFSMDKMYNDRMRLGNFEAWYCRYGAHAFYEMNLDGIVYALGNYILDKRYQYESVFGKFKKCSKNGVAQVHGIDYDFFNFKLAFGTRGVYLGGQFKWTRLGSYTDEDHSVSSPVMVSGIGHSETDMSAVGLGLHANLTVLQFVTQTHLMFNILKGEEINKGEGNFFTGTEIEFESTISLGQGFGGYITPYFKKRTGKASTAYFENRYQGFTSSMSFGIKLGIYLADESDQDNVYIHLLE